MAMETVIGLAIATGRTLVLPPAQRMYLLGKDRGKQRTDFDFDHFFPIYDMAKENDGLNVITMKEFLERVAMTGQMRNKETGLVEYPPDNRTDWDGQDVKVLKEWLRNVTHTPLWSPGSCMASFPQDTTNAAVTRLHGYLKEAIKTPLKNYYLEHPQPVDSSPLDRLRENLASRRELCIYDTEMQSETVIHFMCYHKMRVRMLVHFYAFLFFEDFREDLWMKRFMRYVSKWIASVETLLPRCVILSHFLRYTEIIFDTKIQFNVQRRGLWLNYEKNLVIMTHFTFEEETFNLSELVSRQMRFTITSRTSYPTVALFLLQQMRETKSFLIP